MKKLILSMTFVAVSMLLFSQPWTDLLPKKAKGDYTLYDYQKAFNTYWEPYNVDYGKYTDKNGVVHRAAGWKQFKRWEWDMEPQVDAKTGAMPDKDAAQVYQHWLKSNQSRNSKAADWQPLGPNASGGGYAGVGRINTVAFHPTDNDTYWIGAPAGGLWHTSDNGATWTCLTDANPVLGISDIVIPSDYETTGTIYIATGDRDGWDNRSVGVLKSEDFGATWNATDLSFNLSQNRMTTRLLLDPNDDQTIIAATSAGVFKTTDGGINWNTNIGSTGFIDMEYKPGDYSVLYGSTSGGKIYRSDNGGASWTQVLSISAGRIELAVTPHDPTVVYAIAGASNNGLYGIYKSEDSGQNFTQVFDGTQSGNNLLGWYSGDDSGGQAWYDLSIAVSPVNADLILVGGVNTWQSTDGGQSWNLVSHWYGGFGAQAVHADKHMLKYRSNGDLFECNDGGLYISSSDGSTGSWTDKTNGMQISQMYRLGASQTTPHDIITGLQDNGTKSYDGSQWSDVIGGDGMECIVDYTDENTQYGSLYYGAIHRTLNKWYSDTEITPYAAGDGAWVTPYVLDPNNHETIYAGYANLWKSENQGNSWTQISNIGFSSKIRSIAVAPSNSNVIYIAGTSSVWKTTDGGANWTNISSGLTGNTITYIAVKENDPQKVWVTLGDYDSNGIYESSDGGENWTNISAGLPELPVYTVVYNKLETLEENLYVGTEIGIYFKQGSNSWVAFNSGLPNVKIGELQIHYNMQNPPESKLVAATYGRGLWETPMELSGNYAPAVNTGFAENISYFSAELNGTITDDFGDGVTESGVLISTESNPMPGSATTILTDPLVTNGQFSLTANNLQPATQYFYRAFAENSVGVGLGATNSFTTLCENQSNLPWTEDFEHEGNMPICWSQEIFTGNTSWNFETGNGNSNSTAHSGEYNALLKDTDPDDDMTILYLPIFDLSGTQAAELNFWYAKPNLLSGTDELSVLIKTPGMSDWQTIAYIDENISDWTEFIINLPELSAQYEIAFLGNAGAGGGIMIDDVLIDEINSTANLHSKEIRIFPNPASEFIQVNANSEFVEEVIIHDINGKRLRVFNPQSNYEKIDISEMNSGTYLLTVKTNSFTYCERIIIK